MTGRPAFEDWLGRKLDGLAPGIRADTEAWLRTMRDGGPRSRPRDIASVWNHMNQLRPVLLGWSGRHGHLREVTRDDIAAVLAGLRGSRRANVVVALRSLFAFCKKHETITPTASSSRCARTRSTRQPRPPPPRRPGWCWSWPRCTPPASRPSASSSWTTSTSATGG